MKKIIYNKFTKLFLMLLTLICGGMLIFNTIKITDEYAEYSGENEAIYGDNAYVSNSIRNSIKYTVMDILNSVVMTYVNYGMTAVEVFVENYNNTYGNVFNLIIADPYNIYSTFPDVDVSEVTETFEFVDSDFESEYISRQGNSNVWLEAYTGEVYRWYYTDWISVENYEYITQNTLLDLSHMGNQLAVKVCLTPEYVDGDTFWGDVDGFYNDLYNDNVMELEENVSEIIIDMVMWAAAFIVTLVLSVLICGRTPDGLKPLNRFERVVTEFHLAVIAAGFVGMFGLLNVLMEMSDYYYDYYVYGKDIFEMLDTAYTAILAAAVAIVAVWYIEGGIIIKKLKNRCFVKDFCVVRLLRRMKKEFKRFFRESYRSSRFAAMPEMERLYVKKIVSDVLVAVLLIIIIYMIRLYDGEMWIMADFMYEMTWILIILYFIRSFKEYRYLKEYNRVTNAVSEISQGEYNGLTVLEDEDNDTLVKLSKLSDSFKKSVYKQVESERMQVELVANVSRDLKAPLSSIINYIDMLKNEEMSTVAKDYVKVLVDKSARLKDIVEDVFDLAKATNGEEVEMEQLDGVVLVNQVLSDLSDRIEESGKDLRAKVQSEPASVRGNGQKLYRVFQNVIDNALKYSMPGTRIYLNAESINGEFVVTVKNISEYEIDYTAKEIMSRFTRGDKARHSEGNGLGLSIAKSFTELCGGSFEVELDDDVFMVVIRLR